METIKQRLRPSRTLEKHTRMTTNQNIFDSLVGISGVGTPVQTVNALVTDEVITHLVGNSVRANWWNEIKIMGFDILESNLIGSFKKVQKDFTSVIDATTKVNVSNTFESYTANGLSYVGCVVQVNRTPDKTKLSIKGIDFVSDRAFATNIKVFNLRSGLEVHTAPLAVTLGLNEFVINKDLDFGFGSGLYFIGFLPVSGAVFSKLNQEGNTNYIIQKSGALLTTAFIGVNNVVEIKPYFNVLCNIEYSYTKIIEDNKDKLATAFKYACASKILETLINLNKSASRETLINRIGAENLIEAYMKDCEKFVNNVSGDIFFSLIKTGNLKDTTQKSQMYSLGSFV